MTIEIGTGSSNPMDNYEVYTKIGVFADEIVDSMTLCVYGSELNILHLEA